MRRSAVTRITIEDIEFSQQIIQVTEKGGSTHCYHISQEGLEAIRDYLEQERSPDAETWQSRNLFLTASTRPHGNGQLSPAVINNIWNEVCQAAGVEGKTPHSARHAIGRHIMEKTGNVAAVQRQLGHKNAAYSMQYARITADELQEVLNNRE